MITTEVTMFSKMFTRKNKAGEEYSRQEGYSSLSDLESLVANAKSQGHTVVKVIPTAFTNENGPGLKMSISTFKGKEKASA